MKEFAVRLRDVLGNDAMDVSVHSVTAVLSAWQYKQLVCIWLWHCICTQLLPAGVKCFGCYSFREQLNLHTKMANQDQLQLQAATQQTEGEDCPRATCMSAEEYCGVHAL